MATMNLLMLCIFSCCGVYIRCDGKYCLSIISSELATRILITVFFVAKFIRFCFEFVTVSKLPEGLKVEYYTV